ncbi:MAG: triphosphoribosyl-dephospho-CoA synthase [Hyphomicrobiaceae bacterium]|nr:triphosphoribosyl-dephospho-CoA synthase [Hyphomicrobiaceae bacterium]
MSGNDASGASASGAQAGSADGGATSAAVAAAFLAACRAELGALKPGNVHIHAAGHGMEVAQFEAAAVAAAPHVAARGRPVGERILGAVAASLAAAGCNTNLGIVLLAAPLALAAERALDARPSRTLRDSLGGVLGSLTPGDATAAFAAIAAANPGGLGSVAEGDVRAPSHLSLHDAMALAAGRDRIALAYVTGFGDIFDFTLPALARAREAAPRPDLAITALHMEVLARYPDSHIARKFGMDAAVSVQGEAAHHLDLWLQQKHEVGLATLLAFDTGLKARGINPGTTADLVVATLFAEALQGLLSASPRQSRLV